jgi:hypothetical protein
VTRTNRQLTSAILPQDKQAAKAQTKYRKSI